MLKNERIFITGGAGYLGSNLVKRYYAENHITIFSRDEAKHYYLKKEFPNINCVIGDIRNERLLTEASANHTIGIFTASLKQIEAVDQNIEESLQIIVHGAINSRRASIENNLKAAAFISTDKSRGATTIYGAMKYVAGEAFVANSEATSTRLSSIIYGNVLNSTGSIIPLIWDSIKKNYSLKLYGENMTRFMIDIETAMDCVEYGLKFDGFNIIPNLKAFKIKDLFEIYQEEFGLKWSLGDPRIGEKSHEQMLSPYERERATYDKEHDIFLLHNKNVYNENILSKNGLTSEECLVTKDELKTLLKSYNYFAK
jgi:UDP-N-acetylglucosamine 4,6-dehydratase/5-epimerase